MRYTIKLLWLLIAFGLLLVTALMARFSPFRKPAATLTPTAVRELILYNWADYMPQSVLDDFEAEYGVHIRYVTYEMEEIAAENIQTGKVVFDIAVIENDSLPELIAGGHLATIDYAHVPNFQNITPNFRNQAADPGNQHSIPYNWGTTGLLVRTDLLDRPVTRWADLWDARFAGKIALRYQEYELIGIALKSLGYSINSEDPGELAQAEQRLLALKPSAQEIPVDTEAGVAPLLAGEVVIMVGWSGDGVYARDQSEAIDYILPEDGPILWGDAFVISAKSPNQPAAELFLNFLLRPEISARIVNEYMYSSANEAALPFIDPSIASNPIINVPKSTIEISEWYQPLQAQGSQLRDEIWERFLSP